MPRRGVSGSLTGDVHQGLVGADGDDIVVLQTDIAGELAVEQEVVDVDIRQQSAVAEHLDITQRTDVVGTACHVEGVIDGGKGRHGIGSRHFHLTHHADGDGAGLSEGQLDLGVLKAGTEDASQFGFSLTDGEAAELDHADVLDGDGAVGGDGLRDALL